MINVDLLLMDTKKLALYALLFCGLVYGDAVYLLGGQMKAVTESKNRIASVKAEITAVSRDIALMNQQAGNAHTVTLRSEGDIPDLLRYVSGVAAGHSLKLLQITPVKSREVKAMQSQSYLGFNIKLDLVGGFHNFGGFLGELERGAHPFFADDIKISQGDETVKQRISVNLKSYVKKQ